MAWRSKLWNLIWKRRLNSELDEELQFHLDARTRYNIEDGMSPGAARQEAMRQFGNPTLAKELAREANTFARIESVVQDVAYAVRSLWKNPGFTAVAILTLAARRWREHRDFQGCIRDSSQAATLRKSRRDRIDVLSNPAA